MAIRTGMVGLGKMGISHLAILRAHPDLELVAGCDTMGYLTDILEKHAGLKCYSDFDQMLRECKLDHAYCALNDALSCGDNGAGLLALQHRLGDFRCIGEMGDTRIQYQYTGHFELVLHFFLQLLSHFMAVRA